MIELPVSNNIDNIMPLGDCSDYLDDVSTYQLRRWAEYQRDNGFPEPVETLGKYKLYDIYEIVRWVALWRKVTKHMGRGEELNDSRTHS